MRNQLLTFFVFCMAMFMTLLGHAQDTTAFRWAGFSDGGELILFNPDTSNFYYEPVNPTTGSSYNALFHHPDGRLIALVDSAASTGDRNFVEFEPFMGTYTTLLNTNASFLAAACVLRNGRVFAMTGNGGTGAGDIYEFDLTTQVDSFYMSIPLSASTQNPANLVYRSTTDELLVFAGASDSVYVIDYNNKAYQKVAANLNNDGTLKATYLVGDKLVVASDGLYKADLSLGYDLTPSSVVLADYLSDLENLDMLSNDDSVTICAGDTTRFSSRFMSRSFLWYLDGVPTGVTTQNILVSTPGTYRVLVQVDSAGSKYIWSEPAVLQTVVPAPAFSAIDSLPNTTPVAFTSTGTQGTTIWDFGDGNFGAGSSTSHTYSASGAYVVTMTVNVGACSMSVTDTILVLPFVGISEGIGNTAVKWVTTSPNPSNGNFSMQFKVLENIQAELCIFDLAGKKIATAFQGEMESGIQTRTWNAGTLESGVYIAKLITEKGQLVQRLVVQH